MKWIEDSPSNFKLVDDDDPRPSVTLKSKIHEGAPGVQFSPPWKRYEKGMKHPDNKNQTVYGDKFFAEREHAIQTDPKARRWEESRKKAWADAKPQWVREQQRKEQ